MQMKRIEQQNDPAFKDAPKRVTWNEVLLAWLEFNYMCAILYV